MVYQDLHSALEERMKRYEQVCVIADEAVCLDIPALEGMPVLRLKINETAKSLDTVTQIWDFLFAHEMTRKDLMVAVGGGVLTDLAGFAAATYKRGIDYINIPTTLLSMVDASSGGKTGFNYQGLKNSIGAFYPPVETLICTKWLKTLPAQEFLSGFAEMLKTSIIDRDSWLWHVLLQYDLDTMPLDSLAPLIEECVAVKERIVKSDPRETGFRKVLNFGHTLGHAIEGWHNYTDYTHGMGVAAGMCMMTDRFCAPELAERLRRCVTAYKLPTGTEAPMEELLPYCSVDKKRELDSISFIVCEEVGKAEIRRVKLDEFYRLMGV